MTPSATDLLSTPTATFCDVAIQTEALAEFDEPSVQRLRKRNHAHVKKTEYLCNQIQTLGHHLANLGSHEFERLHADRSSSPPHYEETA